VSIGVAFDPSASKGCPASYSVSIHFGLQTACRSILDAEGVKITTSTVEGDYSIFKRGTGRRSQHRAEKHLHPAPLSE
jgi:hypothetical protein